VTNATAKEFQAGSSTRSTRIAMIDWSRRSSASATEAITEAEQLSNTQP
jgi:hypothetical protein